MAVLGGRVLLPEPGEAFLADYFFRVVEVAAAAASRWAGDTLLNLRVSERLTRALSLAELADTVFKIIALLTPR